MPFDIGLLRLFRRIWEGKDVPPDPESPGVSARGLWIREQQEEKKMLNITKKTENGKLTLALEGRLDTVTAPELEKEVKESLDGVNELEMDCSKLDYISSAGLRVLLSAHKVMTSKGGMKVTHVNEIVAEVFDVTGFADILNIE